MQSNILVDSSNMNVAISKKRETDRSKNVYLYKIIFILILIPYFKPVGIATYPLLNKVFQCGKICTLFFSFLYIINNSKLKLKLNNYFKGICSLVLFEGIYIINTIIYKTSFSDVLNNAITNIFLLCFIYFALMGHDKKIFLDAVNILFSIELFLHIVSVVLAQIGYGIFDIGAVNEYTYLFGRDNYSAFAVLPMLGIVIYIDEIKMMSANKYLILVKDYALIIGLLFCYVWVKSATASVIFMLFFCAFLFKSICRKILAFFDIKKTIILIIIFLAAVIVFNAPTYLASFLSMAFDKGIKGVTLNSRTIIWDMAIKLIKEKPFWGWGVLSDGQIVNYVLYGTEHAHNIVLELMLRTGIIGLGWYLLFLFGACKNYKKIIKSNGLILIVTLQCFLLLSVMDTYLLMQQQYCLIGFIYCYGLQCQYDSNVIEGKRNG